LCDNMLKEVDSEGDSAAVVFKRGGWFEFVPDAVAELILSLSSGSTSTDEESHIVDKPADAEVDVGVKLSAAIVLLRHPLAEPPTTRPSGIRGRILSQRASRRRTPGEVLFWVLLLVLPSERN
jgi:hypothetical protein